jgi:hypothetical protein
VKRLNGFDDTRRSENALRTNRNAGTVKNKLHDGRYRRVLALFSRHHHYTPNGSARIGRHRDPFPIGFESE